MRFLKVMVIAACPLLAVGCVGRLGGSGLGHDDPDAGPGWVDAGRPDAGAADAGHDSGLSGRQCYAERLRPMADVSDIEGRYGGLDWQDELIDAVGRRHPESAYLLDVQRDDPGFAETANTESWSEMVAQLGALVREQTQAFDRARSEADQKGNAVFIREGRIHYLPTSLQGFPRSEIASQIDAIAGSELARVRMSGEAADLGFLALLDEATASINALAAVAAFGEYYMGPRTPARDDALAYLYLVQVYLRQARLEHPELYAALQESDAVRAVVEDNWLRTHLYLPYADRYPSLGIDDARVRQAIHRPDNLDEMAMFLGHPVSDSHCFGEDIATP